MVKKWFLIKIFVFIFAYDVQNCNANFAEKVSYSMNVFFITGTSGSGKSTLTDFLKVKLSQANFAIYDFDENGVPGDADALWRQKTTYYWLTKAQENSKQNKSTIICGVVVPSEGLGSLKVPDISIYFGFMKISDELIRDRLKARGWGDQLIQDNINWAHHLEREVVKQAHHLVIDCSHNTPEKVADIFTQWIYQNEYIEKGIMKTPEIKIIKKMSACDVVELLQLFEQHGIEVFVDGGWGVDALLGKQTRFHGDLDIALEHKYVPKLRELLGAKGYKDIHRDDTRDCNFVLGDDKGHEVDVHSYTFDAEGNNIFGVKYPFDSLKGVGMINDLPVRCISPEWMIKFHTGYNLDENDYQDVLALCQYFGIPLPNEYKKFLG